MTTIPSAPHMPLVSIAIPAYSPRFFEAALSSALNQRYANIEVVITDDCRDDGVRLITERLIAQSTVPVRYLHNEQQLGGMLNLNRCMQESQGEYIKFLNDDDVLLPDCVSRMAAVLQARGDIALVTSRRTIIDAQGEAQPDILETCGVFSEDTCLHGEDIISLLCDWPVNFIGEPSTVMFRRAQLSDKLPHICALGGVVIRAINDLAMFVNLLQHGNLAFLHEPLSLFRRHADQRQNQPDMKALFTQSRADFVEQIHALGLYRPQFQAQVRRRPLPGPQAFRLFALRDAYTASGADAAVSAVSAANAETCDLLEVQRPALPDSEPPVAVVIHAFHPDMLLDILKRLIQLHERLHLYVTCMAERENEVREHLAASGLGYSLFRVPNHGRDVLPFLNVLPFLRADNIHTLVKLHTKRSVHLGVKNSWASDLFDDLLGPVRFRQSVEYLANPTHHPLLGTERYRQAVTTHLAEKTALTCSLWPSVPALIRSTSTRRISLPAPCSSCALRPWPRWSACT
ncbi:glycosyltransferase [Pseudomonas poae]